MPPKTRAQARTPVEGLRPGQPAPEWGVPDDAETVRRLSEFRGRWVVLYFYPKDQTPGCTREACGFRDSVSRLQSSGAVVVGVSPDSAASHRRFKEKHGLTFPLLADTEKRLARAYGVWKPKLLYGRSFLGIERTTFLIDGEGVVRRVYPKVKVDGHVDAVLEALSALQSGRP